MVLPSDLQSAGDNSVIINTAGIKQRIGTRIAEYTVCVREAAVGTVSYNLSGIVDGGQISPAGAVVHCRICVILGTRRQRKCQGGTGKQLLSSHSAKSNIRFALSQALRAYQSTAYFFRTIARLFCQKIGYLRTDFLAIQGLPK